MAITLTPSGGGSVLALPNGLRWLDEYHWSPVVAEVGYSLTGALVLEHGQRLAGRPITLTGGATWAWITRAQLELLRASMMQASAVYTLTLHDARTFTVRPRHDSEGPILTRPLPIVRDSGPADPVNETKYILETIRLWET